MSRNMKETSNWTAEISQSPLVTCATDVTRESVLTPNNKVKTSQRLSFANRVRRYTETAERLVKRD
uniref:Uncharacterized protein n=1 Tax=Magallana gigas TaxID=29159 RepID=K1RN70_MAGGI